MEDQIKHEWAQGNWRKMEGKRDVLEKNDHCILCGMSRTWARTKINGKMETFILNYYRGQRGFGGEGPEPECWGDKNPK